MCLLHIIVSSCVLRTMEVPKVNNGVNQIERLKHALIWHDTGLDLSGQLRIKG